MLTTLIMNDGILERVVASVVNTAQGDLPANTNLLSPQKMNLASINKPIHFTSIRLVLTDTAHMPKPLLRWKPRIC